MRIGLAGLGVSVSSYSRACGTRLHSPPSQQVVASVYRRLTRLVWIMSSVERVGIRFTVLNFL